MKLLVWNSQGLGNAPAVHALLDVQRRCSPDVVFLSETHLDSYPAECLRRRMKMDQKLVCTSNGRSGGLVLFWNNHINVRRISLDTMFIDVIKEDNNNILRFSIS